MIAKKNFILRKRVNLDHLTLLKSIDKNHRNEIKKLAQTMETLYAAKLWKLHEKFRIGLKTIIEEVEESLGGETRSSNLRDRDSLSSELQKMLLIVSLTIPLMVTQTILLRVTRRTAKMTRRNSRIKCGSCVLKLEDLKNWFKFFLNVVKKRK